MLIYNRSALGEEIRMGPDVDLITNQFQVVQIVGRRFFEAFNEEMCFQFIAEDWVSLQLQAEREGQPDNEDPEHERVEADAAATKREVAACVVLYKHFILF